MTKTWSENKPGRWFVHEDKQMVVRIESLGNTWLFTDNQPDGVLEAYWSFLIVDPDVNWGESPTEAHQLIAAWKNAPGVS